MEYKDHEYLKYATSISDEELMEMANISPDKTGIKDVFIWVGPNPTTHWRNWRRIKVSNIPNKFDKKNCFTITVPDFKIIGETNDKLITSKILTDIKKFIKLNMQLICDYSDEKISTDKLIDNIIKI
jgi:hypothetical protein